MEPFLHLHNSIIMTNDKISESFPLMQNKNCMNFSTILRNLQKM